MGSLQECRIEGFVCRLCSKVERNVIHLYTDEGLQKKLEQKINVYLKINLSRYDPLPKVICAPCELKLEQHHRFIQRVIQNQKKILGNRPIIPLLEQQLRVRVTPVEGGNDTTYSIEPTTSSSESSDDDENMPQSSTNLNESSSSTSSSSSSSSSSTSNQSEGSDNNSEELNDSEEFLLLSNEAVELERNEGDDDENDSS